MKGNASDEKIISFFLAAAALMTVCACSGKDEGSKVSSETDGDKVMIEMIIEDFGTVKLELYPDVAPITVENFVNLANEGFYDGLTFHRIYSRLYDPGRRSQRQRHRRLRQDHKGRIRVERRAEQPVPHKRRYLHGEVKQSRFRKQPVLHRSSGFRIP